MVGNVRPILLMLAMAGGLVLAIACANLVNLLLARTVSRAREYAVRLALGAGRWHILRMAWAEALGIAAIGGGAGLVLASGALRVLTVSVSTDLPRAGDIGLSPAAIAFAFALVVLVALSIGAVVGTVAWRSATAAALGDARSRTDGRSRRIHHALVIAQVALSLALVVNASLLVRSLDALVSTDTGAENREVVTLKLSAVGKGFLDRALPRIAALPSVRAAGAISSLPPNVTQMHTTVSTTSPATGRAVDASVDIVSVSPGALEALGVRLVAGRLFTEADMTTDRRPIVISQNTAERLFAGVDAVGRALPFGPQDPSRPPQEIIGVVAPVRYAGLDSPADGAIYLPYTARPFSVTYLAILANASGHDIGANARRVVAEVDSRQAVSDVRSLGSLIRASTSAPRLRTWLISSLAIIALVIAAMGLYAVMSHSVTTRSVEMGVRLALGATAECVRRQVVGEGWRLAVLGIACGAPLSWAGTRVVSKYLYGVTAADPVSIAAALVVLTLATVAAAWVPAVRASRVSPLEAMRR
jgi:predicted permease